MLLKIPQHAKFWPDKQDKLESDSHLWRLFILMEAYLIEKSVTGIKDFQFLKFMTQTQNSVNICISACEFTAPSIWVSITQLCVDMTSGGFSLQSLRPGLGFPTRDLSRPWKYQIQASRPADSDKGPGPQALQKRFSMKTESSEASKVFIKRKNSTVLVDRLPGRLRGPGPELCLQVRLNYFYWAFLLCILWPITSICLIHSPH